MTFFTLSECPLTLDAPRDIAQGDHVAGFPAPTDWRTSDLGLDHFSIDTRVANYRIITSTPGPQAFLPQGPCRIQLFRVDEINRAVFGKNVKRSSPEQLQRGRVRIAQPVVIADQNRIRRHVQHFPVFVFASQRHLVVIQLAAKMPIFRDQHTAPDKHYCQGDTKEKRLLIRRRSRHSGGILRPRL